MAGVAAGIVVVERGHDTATDVVTEPAQFADPHAGTAQGLAQLTDRMALVASKRDPGSAPTGGWVYINSKDTEYFIRSNADTGENKQVSTVSNRQVWMSLDGTKGWLIASGVGQKKGGETLDSGPAPDDSFNWESYNWLAKLPADPDALLDLIHRETVGQGNSQDGQAFDTIGEMLGETYPPAKLYPALYRAAAKIPGVVVVDDAVDAAGRHGVALARVDEGGVREELIFDKDDYTFLGKRRVRTTDDPEGIKAGTVILSMAILERTFVGAEKQLPTN